MTNKACTLSLLIVATFFLSGCQTKTPVKVEPTPTPRLIELTNDQKPVVSLIPRSDGHELNLKISQLSTLIDKIEYELIYTAVDNGLEIEKGVGDTVKIESTSFERKILLGTESCTNGCKYKYDSGINGGTLTLNLITKEGQVSSIEYPFSFVAGKDAKKSGAIDIKKPAFSAKTTIKSTEFYLLIKNPLNWSLFDTSGLVKDYPIAE